LLHKCIFAAQTPATSHQQPGFGNGLVGAISKPAQKKRLIEIPI